MYPFRNKTSFYTEELLAPLRTPKLEDHPLSALRDCLFNIFAAAPHIGSRSSILNPRTPMPWGQGLIMARESPEFNIFLYISCVRFEFLAALNFRIIVLWDAISCCLVVGCRRLELNWCFSSQGRNSLILDMEAGREVSHPMKS
jgi:hypothetical protein